MPYAPVTVLPPAPSKVSNPVNFVNQAALFLQALPTFRTQHNTLLTYINTKYPNKWNCGLIGEVNPTLPVNPTFTNPTGTGVVYVSAVDTFYAALTSSSSVSNDVGAYADAMIAQQGSSSSDANRTTVPALSAAPARTQALAAFNTTADAFTNSVITSGTSLNANLSAIHSHCFNNDDYGLITDATITETIDANTITDATITN